MKIEVLFSDTLTSCSIFILQDPQLLLVNLASQGKKKKMSLYMYNSSSILDWKTNGVSSAEVYQTINDVNLTEER